MSASIIRYFGFGRIVLMNGTRQLHETKATKLLYVYPMLWKQKGYVTCVLSRHTSVVSEDNGRHTHLSACMNNHLHDGVIWQMLQSVHGILMVDHRYIHTSQCHAKIKSKQSNRGRNELEARLEEERKIQVFGVDDSELMSVMMMSLARRKAQRDGLNLVVVDENAEPYPVYRLTHSNDEMKDQREKKKLVKKEEKTFQIKVTISDHDLGVKLKHIKEYLEKGKGVLINVIIQSRGRIPNQETSGELQLKVLKHFQEQLNGIAVINEASRSPKELRLRIISKASKDTDSCTQSSSSSDTQPET